MTGKLADDAVRAWTRSGERIEGRTDGDGLVLIRQPERSAPSWKLRHRFADKWRVMSLGSSSDLRLVALGVEPHVAERCLNLQLKALDNY